MDPQSPISTDTTRRLAGSSSGTDSDDPDRNTAYAPPGSLTYEFNLKKKQQQAQSPGTAQPRISQQTVEDEEYYARETGDNSLARERSMSLVKRTIPEDWEDDDNAVQCKNCNRKFSLLVRKHHCRNCGLIFCDDCTKNRSAIKTKNYHTAVRVCGRCSFSLSKGRELLPNLQLKHQISAMEDVSQALMQENQHLRSLMDNMEQINKEQHKTIQLLCQQEQQFLEDIRKLKLRLSALQPLSGSPPVSGVGLLSSTPPTSIGAFMPPPANPSTSSNGIETTTSSSWTSSLSSVTPSNACSSSSTPTHLASSSSCSSFSFASFSTSSTSSSTSSSASSTQSPGPQSTQPFPHASSMTTNPGTPAFDTAAAANSTSTQTSETISIHV